MRDLKLIAFRRVWHVTREESQLVAEIHLDILDQVDEIVLYNDCPQEMQLEVLRLAASHVRQYVRDRVSSVFGGMMLAEHRNPHLTRADSDRLMDFSAIPPEIKELDRETIVRGLDQLHIPVTLAVHRTTSDAVATAIREVCVEGLTCEVVPEIVIFRNETLVRFSVREPNRFTFWYHLEKPRDGFDLHIVPAYHPVMNRSGSIAEDQVGMVNGSTDAYIRGYAVRSICSPEDARVTDSKKDLGTTWSHMKHPFYATGQSVMVRLVTTKIRSVRGVKELTQLLRAALGLDHAYVTISGGFRAPLKCAHNRLLELGQRSPWPQAQHRPGGNVARGSEERCVWEHRVLTEEGAIKDAYVPRWFLEEGWLRIYEGAEVGHGLY